MKNSNVAIDVKDDTVTSLMTGERKPVGADWLRMCDIVRTYSGNYLWYSNVYWWWH